MAIDDDDDCLFNALCALVRTFSLSVCFSVIAVILLTDTWLLDNRIFAS